MESSLTTRGRGRQKTQNKTIRKDLDLIGLFEDLVYDKILVSLNQFSLPHLVTKDYGCRSSVVGYV